MKNTNCLEGFKCPNCGHTESFKIWAEAEFDFEDEGSGDYSCVTFDNLALCTCSKCGHASEVRDFKKEEVQQ